MRSTVNRISRIVISVSKIAELPRCLFMQSVAKDQHSRTGRPFADLQRRAVLLGVVPRQCGLHRGKRDQDEGTLLFA
jgi:hypothetical protein